MTDYLRPMLNEIRANFWFVPTLLSVFATLAAVVFAQMDFAIYRNTALVGVIPLTMSVESARLALSTIAGSMITIASLVFSMTLVALTTVSQQLGPRILMRFMDDRPTQITLGLFLAAFLFSLILLMQMTSQEQGGYVPGVGVIAAAALAIGALAGMIHFFDHVSKRIQADSIIAELGGDLRRAATLFVDTSAGDGQFAERAEPDEITQHFSDKPVAPLTKMRSGYLGPVAINSLLAIADKHRLIVRMVARQNEFVLAGTPICDVASSEVATSELPADDVIEQMTGCFTLHHKRTPEASVEFEISALVEVALRALSPGINDPYTARACVDRLADGLRILSQRDGDRRVARAENGTIRLLHPHEPLERYLKLAFDPIFAASSDQELVREHLSQRLRDLTGGATSEAACAVFADYTRGLAGHDRSEPSLNGGSRQASGGQPQPA